MTIRSVTACCPGHISGYFKRIAGANPAATGSIGAGIVISEGVKATVTRSTTSNIRILRHSLAGKTEEIHSDSPPLRYALGRLGIRADIVTECNLPIGAGFGLSAAALIATLSAASRLYNLDISAHAITLLAHETEVIHKTGLGDVSACQAGGRVIRKGPGIDADIERVFDIHEPLFAVCFGPIHTPTVLGSAEQMERVSAAYPPEYPHDPASFFALSRQFAQRSGLMTPEVKIVLDACSTEGIPASMTMLGNGVFACGRDAKRILGRFGQVFEFSMAGHGVKITGEQS